MHHGFCGHCTHMNNLYVLGYYIVQENENCRDNHGLFPEYLPTSSARVDRPIRSTRAEDSGRYPGYQIIKLPPTWRCPAYHVPLLSVIGSLRGDNGMRHMGLTFIINVIEIKYHLYFIVKISNMQMLIETDQSQHQITDLWSQFVSASWYEVFKSCYALNPKLIIPGPLLSSRISLIYE